MSDDDFGDDLAAIAAHGHRTGRLAEAGELRARGDRRRRNRYAATSVFGVVLAAGLGLGITMTRPHAEAPLPSIASPTIPVPSPATPSAAPSVSASVSKTPTSKPPSSPARSTPATGGGDVLTGKRQVFLFPLDDGATVPDSVAAVTDAGRLDITDDFGDRALLVPVPKSAGSKEFQLKTGKLRSGGEALCMQIQGNGANPLTLVTKACDATQKDQLFKFDESGRDKQGRMTYLISVGGGYYVYYFANSPDEAAGLIVQESGEGDGVTRYVIIDRGKATLPDLE